MPEYRYSPLSPKPNVTRLLRLQPSKGEPENIICELSEYTLRDSDAVNHPYEALSYVWGDGTKPKSITILDGQKRHGTLPVTENLYAALLRLRDDELPRTIWVDAICIYGNLDDEFYAARNGGICRQKRRCLSQLFFRRFCVLATLGSWATARF